ncbi:MAG: hypothetical protein ACK5X3_00390 [Pseudomonadota bacterium]|jgi:hypothetical protein
MGEPTWQEITAEAIRRKAQALKDGRGDIELEGLIVEITREGWTPPPAVDPDILAFREWLMKREPDMRRQSYAYDADFWDNCLSAQAFLAGARMAREQMPSLRDVVEWIAENNNEDLGNDDDGYQIIVYLVAALFDLEPHDVVYAVTLQRAGCSWRLGDIRARDPAAPAKNTGEKRDD